MTARCQTTIYGTCTTHPHSSDTSPNHTMLVPQTNTMTNQVQSLEQEIEPDKDQDWSQSLRAGPECLAILGECILLTTRPSVTGIELEGPGLLCVAQRHSQASTD